MLLMAVNTAATGITREREAQTMELLLATPLTSQYIVWGKLRGLVSFTVPLIAVPVASVVPFVIFDLFAAPKRPVVYPEALLTLPLLMLAYSALACLLGLHTSLKSRRTVQAVLTSVGILVVLGFGVGACGYVFTSSAADSVGPLVAPFTMVVAIATAVNPELTLQTTAASTIAAARVLMLVGSLIALGVYAAAVHAIYKSMVKNFDMIVRKQSV
jgi:ABC-type Na+ efflux pump permease subunit